MSSEIFGNKGLFDRLKEGLLSIDPVWFCQTYLTLDGNPFSLSGNGYKPFADIYRYIGSKALGKDGKPVVLVKGRQVGATTMAAALELYFMTCGLFGTAGRPPMRVMHAFPLLDLSYTYTKTKLNTMISTAVLDDQQKKGFKPKTYIEARIDKSQTANDSLQFKQFLNGNHLLIESTGLTGDRIRGRQLCLDTEIPTPNGFVNLRDVTEGDTLFDDNGDICTVTKVHPIQESPESYRVTFDDGTTVDACAEHLWVTYTKRDRINVSKGKVVKPKIKNTKEILDTLKVNTNSKYPENNHSIPVCLPVKYSKKELLIDPYIFGLWLGDGNRSGQIENADPEVLQNCDISKSCSYGIPKLVTKLNKLGLVYNQGLSRRATHDGYYYKYIPKEYLQSSIEDRLALLQGLMDSDGCCYKDGRCEISPVRERLAYDIFDLILSLGIKARIRKKKSLRYSVRYCIFFCTNLPVFKLNRKLDNGKLFTSTKAKHRFIKSIDMIKPKPMRCITVDSPSHLYLITRKFISTHNTMDCLLVDEAQDVSGIAIANTIKCLSQAHYGPPGDGIQVYFGTPKQKGSDFWDLWQASSKQYYYLGCERCGKHFPLYTPESNKWEEVWIDDNIPAEYKDPKTNLEPHGFIVKCIHCGHEQDKRPAAERGKWVSSVPNSNDCKFVGYHLNQLFMPKFSRQRVLSEKPEVNPINTERAYQNEVLGEFFAGDASPITPEQMKDLCADEKRTFRRNISMSENIKVYLGADWGQKVDVDQLIVGDREKKQRGQSYSSVVVLSAEGPHILSVEYAKLLKRNDLEYKRAFIDETFRRYSVHMGIGDIGFANDLTEVLQQDYGERFLASRAVPKIKGHAKYTTDIFPKEVAFERNYYIAELYDLMKKGRIRFPYGSYEQIGWLIQHCCSMEIVPKMSKTGNIEVNYIKGSTPNDGFMALLNAYIAFKWDITDGFTITHPNNMQKDPTKSRPILAVVGYIPRMNPLKR